MWNYVGIVAQHRLRRAGAVGAEELITTIGTLNHGRSVGTAEPCDRRRVGCAFSIAPS